MGWLNGWKYRKKITIQGQSGAGTDYQVLLKVGESSGASGCDFHVEGHSANFPNANDDFDDNSLDSSLWSTRIYGEATIQEQDGKVKTSLSGTAGTNYVLLNSKFCLMGDFDIQIDFLNLSLPDISLTFIRGFNVFVNNKNFAYLERRYDGSHRYYGAIQVEGNETYGAVNASDTSGKFRAKRTDSTLTFYYWDGSSWQQIHQRTDFPKGLVVIQTCEIYTNNGATASVFWDNFTINSGTIVKAISGDLRFTKSDGTTLLNFWVEKVEGTSPNRVAYCWVKVADNLDNNVDIYCYYGNSNADDVSDGDGTFIFFDDFYQFDNTKWDGFYDIYNSGQDASYDIVANCKLRLKCNCNDNNAFISDVQLPDKCVLYSPYTLTSEDNTITNRQVGFVLCYNKQTTPNDKYYFVRFNDSIDKFEFKKMIGGTNATLIADADVGQKLNGFMEIVFQTSEIKAKLYDVNQSLLTTLTSTDTEYMNDRNFGFFVAYDTGSMAYFSYIYMRKYNPTEPSFSSAENEQCLKISGQVTLNGNPVENATVIIISTEDKSYVNDTTTDVNGNYSFTGFSDINKKYHLMVEYEDNDGQKYNALSKWAITPVIT